MTWLYRTELKAIQAWILATDKLRELVGGSDAIEHVVELAREQVLELAGPEAVRSAAAGGLTVYFPDKASLERFASGWPFQVDHLVPGLQMVQAWVEMADPDAHSDAEWQAVQDRLAAARNLPWPELPQAGPLVARAGRSGRPAVGRGAAGLRDRAMEQKELRARGGGAEAELAMDRLARKLVPSERWSFLSDLDAFGEGYVAVVHVDANSVGERLQGGAVRSYRDFSRGLEEATRRAARQAIERTVSYREEPGDSRVLRARPVVMGGDDFTILCRGDEGLLLAEQYLRAFEDETGRVAEQLGGAGLRACAGVVFARPGWPFSAAHALAEELCAAAKRHCKAAPAPTGGRGVSGLAFHRVTTSLASDWAGIRRDELSRIGERVTEVLTANPYTLERLELLAVAADAAEELPRGALRRWVGLARTDPEGAVRHWKRLKEVASDGSSRRWAVFAAALEKLGVEPESGWEPSVDTPAGREKRTPIPDILERLAVRRAGRGGSDR